MLMAKANDNITGVLSSVFYYQFIIKYLHYSHQRISCCGYMRIYQLYFIDILVLYTFI